MSDDEMKPIDLTKAEDCRWYIDNFEFPNGPATYATMSSGRKIYFKSMTDDDAIIIANDLYRMELEAETRVKNNFVKNGGVVQ